MIDCRPCKSVVLINFDGRSINACKIENHLSRTELGNQFSISRSKTSTACGSSAGTASFGFEFAGSELIAAAMACAIQRSRKASRLATPGSGASVTPETFFAIVPQPDGPNSLKV